MAMSGNVLGDAMMAAVDALTLPDKRDRQKVFRAMAAAIVTHISSMGVVTVTSVSGVTTGAGVSGPGVGTIA